MDVQAVPARTPRSRLSTTPDPEPPAAGGGSKVTCPACGHALPEEANFCPNCGTAVGQMLATEERKVVTVVFVDLVDSTGLAQRLDPERAREVLGQFFGAVDAEIRALRGRCEKFIGDAIMAVFGLDHVDEDDAQRAVRAGLAVRGRAQHLQHTLGLDEPLVVRIGVESGEAATGLGPEGQLLVTGPVVNAAARLQAAARPGEVLAGETTRALTMGAITYGKRRRVRARGFATELAAFPVEGPSTRSAGRTIPFVGRTSEQAILGQSLGLAAKTGRPVLVTVVGEAGIGKSRLAEELAAGVGAGVRALIGRAGRHTDTATFAPIATIVAELAGIGMGGKPEEMRRRLRELVVLVCDASEVALVTEQLALVFGLAERPEESTFVNDVHAGFIALIDGLAREHPALVVFEDAHTLRPPMLDLIERLGTRGHRGPRRALILVLGRPELLDLRPRWGGGGDSALMIRLEPLSPADAAELARLAAAGGIDEAQAVEIATRAGGNPFFIIETTGILALDGTGAASRRRALPPTVQAVVSARLDHLPARLRQLTRRASVFVTDFDLDELAAVDPAASLDELHLLETFEILVREERPGAPVHWRLRHSILRDVAYSALPKRERLRLHRLVAKSLESSGHVVGLSDHLELAALASLDLNPNDRTVPDRAADALVQAGDRARRRMESRSAIDRYERALAIAGPESEWGVREARALTGMGEAHYWLGEYRTASNVLERALAPAQAAGDHWALAMAWRLLGDIAINLEGDVDKAERLLQLALASAEQLGDPRVTVRTLLFAGWVPWNRRQYDEAEATWRRALAMAEPSDAWARVRTLVSISVSLSSRGDPDAALQLVEEASALAERTGDRFSVAVAAVQKARVLEELGRYGESLPWFDRGIQIYTELGARWELADARAERGVTMRELGRLAEAEDDLKYALRVLQELGERQLGGWVWRAYARLAESQGKPRLAEERYRRSQEAEARGPH